MYVFLTAVHFTADYTLGILNRNPALGACHKSNEGDDGKEKQADADNCEVVVILDKLYPKQACKSAGPRGNDTCKV